MRGRARRYHGGRSGAPRASRSILDMPLERRCPNPACMKKNRVALSKLASAFCVYCNTPLSGPAKPLLAPGRTCARHGELLFMELAENRKRIRLSCLTCLAEQMLPDRLRRHAEAAERARKSLEDPEKDPWPGLVLVVGLGAVGAFLGLFWGGLLGDPESGLKVGAAAGAAYGVKVRIDQLNSERDAAREALRRPAPTVQDIRNEIRDRPQRAAEEVIAFMQELRERYERETSGIEEVDRMGGDEFEQLIASVFERRGYVVRRTPGTRDYGVDLIIERGANRIAVQCKRRRLDTALGPSAVQEVYSGKEFYQCTRALVVTNVALSEQARAMAERLGVEVWERDRLTAELAEGQKRLTWQEYLAQYYETGRG